MRTRLARFLIAFAAFALAVATGLGAWASHAADAVLDAAAVESFTTAVDYQFFHALGLLALGLLVDRKPRAPLLGLAGIAIAAGIVLFSGGVYASSLGGPAWIGSLAPAGGICLILAWTAVAASVLFQPSAT